METIIYGKNDKKKRNSLKVMCINTRSIIKYKSQRNCYEVSTYLLSTIQVARFTQRYLLVVKFIYIQTIFFTRVETGTGS